MSSRVFVELKHHHIFHLIVSSRFSEKSLFYPKIIRLHSKINQRQSSEQNKSVILYTSIDNLCK